MPFFSLFFSAFFLQLISFTERNGERVRGRKWETYLRLRLTAASARVGHTECSALDGVIRHRHRHRMPILAFLWKAFRLSFPCANGAPLADSVLVCDGIGLCSESRDSFHIILSLLSIFNGRLSRLWYCSVATLAHTQPHTLYPAIRTDWRHHSRCADFLSHLTSHKSVSILIRWQCVCAHSAKCCYLVYDIYFPLLLRIKITWRERKATMTDWSGWRRVHRSRRRCCHRPPHARRRSIVSGARRCHFPCRW